MSRTVDLFARQQREPKTEKPSFNGALGRFGAILVDPPWRFTNRTGKVGPEHKRLHRYRTMSYEEIVALPLANVALPTSHLYLWCPNALVPEALTIMKAWGFTYKTNIVWYKVRKDGGPDGRGVGFYFRNVTELLLCHAAARRKEHVDGEFASRLNGIHL